jgi:hypothetical protein
MEKNIKKAGVVSLIPEIEEEIKSSWEEFKVAKKEDSDKSEDRYLKRLRNLASLLKDFEGLDTKHSGKKQANSEFIGSGDIRAKDRR